MENKPTSPLAIGKSISFRPGSLYDDAVAYGEAQKELTGSELNVSEVVCKALNLLFDTEGFARPSKRNTGTDHHSEFMASASEVGFKYAASGLELMKRLGPARAMSAMERELRSARRKAEPVGAR